MGLEIDEDRFVDYNWPRALHALGIRYRKFHATRHTFITCARSPTRARTLSGLPTTWARRSP
jgi:hypothetical protein